MPDSGRSAKGHDEAEAALYQVPLADFTPARNALVTRLKKAGKVEQAARIKGLIKPSISAWAVNQVFWHHRDAFDALIAVGERFRQAQASQIKGEPSDLRRRLEERRESLASLSTLAASILRGAGHNPTPDTMRRITSTLEALSISSTLPDMPQPGRLIDDVDPPGFETLAALVPRVADDDQVAGGPSRLLAFRQQPKPQRAPAHGSDDERTALRKTAAAAVQHAERALRAARKDAEAAEALLKTAARTSKDAETARLVAEAQLEKASAGAEAARQAARKTAAAAESATQAVEDAERALARARSEVDHLNGAG